MDAPACHVGVTLCPPDPRLASWPLAPEEEEELAWFWAAMLWKPVHKNQNKIAYNCLQARRLKGCE